MWFPRERALEPQEVGRVLLSRFGENADSQSVQRHRGGQWWPMVTKRRAGRPRQMGIEADGQTVRDRECPPRRAFRLECGWCLCLACLGLFPGLLLLLWGGRLTSPSGSPPPPTSRSAGLTREARGTSPWSWAPDPARGEGTHRGDRTMGGWSSDTAAERPSTVETEKQSLGLLAGGPWTRHARRGAHGVCPEPEQGAWWCHSRSGASGDQGTVLQLVQDIWL